ncbi:MAG: hypothetical protein JJU19_01130 [Pararhodobacter sp.]|nr:hypothetical protein [Pararhodobacter sp.]
MQGPISKTTVVFAEPFRIPGLDELLPAGAYDLETEIDAPPEHLHPESWKASVLVRLHPRLSHPGMNRTLTVALSALDNALARDKLTGRGLVDFFIEDMLSDPMIRLVMAADRVSDSEIRQIYARASRTSDPEGRTLRADPESGDWPPSQDAAAHQRAENEGMPPRRYRAQLAKTRPIG